MHYENIRNRPNPRQKINPGPERDRENGKCQKRLDKDYDTGGVAESVHRTRAGAKGGGV